MAAVTTARGLFLLLLMAGRNKRGEPGAGWGVQLDSEGRASVENGFGMALIACLALLDQREAVNAKERVGLDHEPLVRNFFVTPVAPAIAVGSHQLQGALDTAQLVKSPDSYLDGKILPESL
jgi:hypothetical protein